MNAERWREVSRIYGAVLTKPESDRATALASLCANDAELRREVESLLQLGQDVGVLDRAATERPSALGLLAESPVGSMIGVFRIDALLGVGGMGEVYRARDTKLNRDVAIKILPAAFAGDSDRLARFKREAQVLASLNHPHIGAIYGFEDAEGVHALVMELVEGPTLADRIARGPLPVDEALAIARQIADALEAAHELGIVHRDLKPANIKVRNDGTVKVLDFGLAKMLESTMSGAGPAAAVTQSPTITTPAMTAAGMILGTAAYMSPEQAKGKPADKRSDIWAFGCVLYEMLAGTRAFAGEDVGDTLANILKSTPDWLRMSAETPASVRRLLRRCLERDVRRRLPHIGVARIEIDESANEPRDDAALSVPTARRRERLLWGSALVLLAVAVVGALAGRRPPGAPPELRLDLATPPTPDPLSMAISPDGQRVVYLATVNDHSLLFLRELNAATARPLARTENAEYPFWSPDNRSIAFFANGMLQRIDLDGDIVRPIISAALGRGGAWSADGTILFARSALSSILRTTADGGPAQFVTALKPSEASHSFPWFLPDGRQFLYFVAAVPEVRGVYLGALNSHQGRRLFDADSAAIYDGRGHVLYVRQGTLFAQSFEPKTGALTDRPVPVAEGLAVRGGSTNAAALSAATNGTIVFRAGSAGGLRQFVTLKRNGQDAAPPREPDPGFPANPAASGDGRRVLLSRIVNGNGDIWLLDLFRRGPPSRVTSDVVAETYPTWSPDGDHVVFTKGGTGLVVRSLSSGAEAALTTRNSFPGAAARADANVGFTGVIACDWSRDGKYVLIRMNNVQTGFDLGAVGVSGEGKMIHVAQGAANEREGQFSPDGKWVAYQSDESGRYEIYVQRFPEGTDKLPISTQGGAQVRWRADGQELFYIALDNHLMAVAMSVGAGGRLEAGSPTTLFSTHVGGAVLPGFRQQYVVSPDAQTFLMNNIIEDKSSMPITVLLNWRHRDP